MFGGDVAVSPLLPLERLMAPAVGALRRTTIARLAAAWSGEPVELVLPAGQRVRLGGRGDAAVARVHDERLFLRLLVRGEMGAGESYVAGEWSSDDLVDVIRRFLRATLARGRGVESPLTWLARLPARLRHRHAANTRRGSARNIHAHYDLGNAFYQLFLDDETLGYSCALWSTGARTLADAQRAKLDRLCDWLDLQPGDRVLEIGCGWGGMAIHAARTRGCRVTAITISAAQHQLATARVAAAGLADRVEVQLRDYRTLGELGRFDKLVSIEMLEAVGFEYLPGFFAICRRALRPGAPFALQTITMPDARFETYRREVDWMQTYVFPGSLIPSLGAVQRAAGAWFEIGRVEDIGPDYVPTLRTWSERFAACVASRDVAALGFDEAFVRTWSLYLAFSEAAFAEQTLGDHHLLLTSRG